MPVKIPFNLGSVTPVTAAANSGPVKVGLPIGALTKLGSDRQSGALANSRQQQIIMAVAVAAGIYDPKESVKTAKLAEEKPEDLVCPAIDEDRINRILRTVAAVIDNPSSGPSASDKIKDTCSAVGASPALAAAALSVIESGANQAQKDALAKDARLWAGSLESKFLGRAAHAAARVKELRRIADPTTRLAIVEEDVVGLDKRVTTLETAAGGAPAAPRKKTAKKTP